MKPILGPKGQRCTRLELHLTTTCPEKCVFCSEDERMRTFKKFPTTWGRVAKTLRDYAAQGIEHLHLTGGEPTIHPRFLDVLRLAKKLGMRTSIGTIGTRLAEPDFAQQALPLLDEALFSVHGPDAATHDALTRVPGSFDKQLRAIELARQRPGFLLAVNTVMCRPNIEKLPDTVAFLDALGPALIVVSNTTPEGAAYEHYEELAVPLATLARVLPQVPSKARQAVLRFFGVPMCLLAAEHRMLSNDLHWDPRVTVEWNAPERGKVAFSGWPAWDPGRKRARVAACTECSMQGVCMGVYARYAELWPTEELTPLV